MERFASWMEEARIISELLKDAPEIDREFRVSSQEFQRRQKKLMHELEKAGLEAAIVYSDEHYNGDVPYLGGNTNITVEPVAGIIGKNGFHILAGLEGGSVAEQLSPRSGAIVHKVRMMKPGSRYDPKDAKRVEGVIEEAVGCKPEKIGILTPRFVLPVGIYMFLESYLGGSQQLINVQELYQKLKYEKSDEEMKLVEEASKIADQMIKGMLYVLKPGMYETQVAQWGYSIAFELGAEEMGFDIMVTSGENNRSLLGKALNKKIEEGSIVHLGVAPKMDGLTSCQRASVVALTNPKKIRQKQKFWLEFVEEAFEVGLRAYREVAEKGLPPKIQEQALLDYYTHRQDEVSKIMGRPINLAKLKPYTAAHNAGYTEGQEFYGSITLDSTEPLGNQIVTMLDVAVKGIGSRWDKVVIPGIDFVVAEKTLGKYGKQVKVLNRLPVKLQDFVGEGYKKR